MKSPAAIVCGGIVALVAMAVTVTSTDADQEDAASPHPRRPEEYPVLRGRPRVAVADGLVPPGVQEPDADESTDSASAPEPPSPVAGHGSWTFAVVDAGGYGVPGVAVSVAFDGSDGDEIERRTDPRGEVVLIPSEGATGASVTIRAGEEWCPVPRLHVRRHGSMWAVDGGSLREASVADDGSWRPVRWTLWRRARIAGRVLDEDGDSVEGAIVSLLWDRCVPALLPERATTASDGTYSLAAPRCATVTVVARGRPDKCPFAVAPGVASGSLGVVLRAPPRVRVQGRVVRSDGTPYRTPKQCCLCPPAPQVRARGPHGVEVAACYVPDGGVFSLDVPDGDVHALSCTRGSWPLSPPRALREATPSVVCVRGAVDDVVLVFADRAASPPEGREVIEGRLDGCAEHHEFVVVEAVGERVVSRGRPAHDGRFCIAELEPGAYELRVRAGPRRWTCGPVAAGTLGLVLRPPP